MGSLAFNEQEATKLWKLLGFGNEHYAQLQCIDVRQEPAKFVSRLLTNNLQTYLQWARNNNGKGNCFVGRNPRNSEGKVKHVSCVSLDLDPIREKGTASTDEQIASCVRSANKIGQRFGGGSLALSGNGALLLWTSTQPLQASKDTEGGCKVLQDEAQKLCEEGVKVDATHDAPRLIKLIATVSVKGGIRATRFLHLSGAGGGGAGVFEFVERMGAAVPPSPKELLAESGYPSRSEAVFAIAVHCEKAGISRENCRAALKANPYGREESDADINRIISKVYGPSEASPLAVSGADSPGVSDSRGSVCGAQVAVDRMRSYLNDEASKPLDLITGIEEIDAETYGIRRGEIFTIAALTGAGKTSLALNIAAANCRIGKRVLCLSTEFPLVELWWRLTSIGSGIPTKILKDKVLIDEHKKTLDRFYANFVTWPIHFYDGLSPSLHDVSGYVSSVKPDLLIFDHIQHIDSMGLGEREAIKKFMEGLHNMAKAFNMGVLCVSQFRRPQQALDFKTKEVFRAKPSKFDLKGAGEIENESAFVLLMHEGETVDNESKLITCELDKNRYGSPLATNLVFHGPTQRFRSLKGE